jgi:uncharacterized protein (TIGR00251 family)
MGISDCLRDNKSGVLIDVTVVPGSKVECLEYDDWGKRLRVKINAPPSKGKANKRLLSFFSDFFGSPNVNCKIASGTLSRDKTIEIAGIGKEKALNLLKNKVKTKR